VHGVIIDKTTDAKKTSMIRNMGLIGTGEGMYGVNAQGDAGNQIRLFMEDVHLAGWLDAIYFTYGAQGQFNNVHIGGVNGIYLKEVTDAEFYGLYMQGTPATGSKGLYADGLTSTSATLEVIGGFINGYEIGVHASAWGDLKIIGACVDGVTGTAKGIYLDNCVNSHLIGNFVSAEANNTNAIHINNGSKITVNDNTCPHSGYGIQFSGGAINCIANDNTCYDNNLADLRLDTVTYMTVAHNYFGSTTKVSTNGVVTNIGYDHNQGYITESSGSGTGNGAEQTIAHGLVSTPKLVTVVPNVTGATVSSVWADATNIYCTVTNGKTYNWRAEVGC
jgi:hypothetical protein